MRRRNLQASTIPSAVPSRPPGQAEHALSVLDHISGSTLTPAQTLGIQFSRALNCLRRLRDLVSTRKIDTLRKSAGSQLSYPVPGSFSSHTSVPELAVRSADNGTAGAGKRGSREAGVEGCSYRFNSNRALDSRFRGNDEKVARNTGIGTLHRPWRRGRDTAEVAWLKEKRAMRCPMSSIRL